MTDNLIERKFFEAFGIEPIFDNTENGKRYRAYPKITDRILLELICLRNKFSILEFGRGIQLNKTNVNSLKDEILEDAIIFPRIMLNTSRKERYYHEVRAVFGLESEEK